MSSINKIAKMEGVLHLLMAVLAGFSMMHIPSTLIVPGDAARTANNIMASEGLFRLSIVSDTLVVLIEIALVVLLYRLIKPVSRTLSLVATFSRLAMTIMMAVNLLNHLFVLLLLSGASYLTVFETAQLHALVLLFLDAHSYLVFIWGLLFALHLLVLGYLVYKSGYISRIPGVLLVIASFCYLIQDVGTILLPEYKATFASIGYLSTIEIVFPIWLLIKGVNREKWEKRTLVPATV
jgi:hypothetical protein